MNLHLHHVVSDISGLSGLRIIEAIWRANVIPANWPKLRDPRVRKSTVAQMEAALVGDYRPEHLFVLDQSLQAYRFYQARIEECDHEIEPLLQQLAERFECSSSPLAAESSQPEVIQDQAAQSQNRAAHQTKKKTQAQSQPAKDRFKRLLTTHLWGRPHSSRRAGCLECTAHCLRRSAST